MKCTGIVLASILGITAAMVALFAGVGALLWVSEQSVRFFGLGGMWNGAFMFGYLAIGLGTFVGVTICREQQS